MSDARSSRSSRSSHIRPDPNDTTVPRFLSQEGCHALIAQVLTLGIQHEQISLLSRWRGGMRWGRNRVNMASDWRTNEIDFAGVGCNQLDPTSLRAMVELVQQQGRVFPDAAENLPPAFAFTPPVLLYPKPHIWSDATYTQTPNARSVIATQLVAQAERAGMLSAGYLSVEARGTALHTADGRYLYAPQTLAQCSMTVRDPQGTGSGWAGKSSYDWTRFDAEKLAEIALDKCLRSRNPVRIEPGRYTLILEPQATFDFVSVILRDGLPLFIKRDPNECIRAFNDGCGFPMPFQKRTRPRVRIGKWEGGISFDPTRIGERIFDERVSLTFDPLDPDLGVLPFTDDGDPYEPVAWFDKGVLMNLAYDRAYALQTMHRSVGKPDSGAFRMDVSGPTTSIEEMIATTKRGLIVTRFWGLELVDEFSMLYTGVTRDGLWLIENGKISHPVKNLRWTESPLFALNQVEQLGVPVPVFTPEIPAITPPMKVRDFSFTALLDAV